MVDANIDAFVRVEKEDGRYKILAVSTAEVEDGEGETFTTRAMDYDIALAERTGVYPEFRVFHEKGLGIGKVNKMSRVGIFAVDEGYSYEDPFSLHVVEKMLLNNDGRWKVSRGFEVHEMSGGCLNCGEQIVVGLKHMIAGYKCPSCRKVYMVYKGDDGRSVRSLDLPHFLKTRTFDITVTDVPAVPVTGVSAFYNMEYVMDKKQLRKRLIEAGLDEEIVDGKLESLSPTALKELKAMEDLPYATLLKELTDETDEEDEEDVEEELEEEVDPDSESDDDESEEVEDGDEAPGEDLVLDESVVDEIATEVVGRVKELFEGAEFTVSNDASDGMEIEFKEFPAVTDLQKQVASLSEMVLGIKEAIDEIRGSETKRLKSLVRKSSAAGRLRVIRTKGAGPDDEDEDEDDEEYEDEDEDDRVPATLHQKKSMRIVRGDDGVFVPGAEGQNAGSLSDFLRS